MATFIKQTLDNGEVILNLDYVEYVRKEDNGAGGFVYSVKTTALPFPVSISEAIYIQYSSLVPSSSQVL